MKKIALTGGIGSGKSTVCKAIEQLGFPVFYSDIEAKKILLNDLNVKQEIISLLGSDSYKNGDLDRNYIASQIFNDPFLKEKMNAIVHPAVREKFEKWASDQRASVVFNEAAIIFETGAYKNFDLSILITSPIDLKIERIAQRDNSSIDEAQLRINNQWSDEQKSKLADYILVNDEKQPLLNQIINLIDTIKNN